MQIFRRRNDVIVVAMLIVIYFSAVLFRHNQSPDGSFVLYIIQRLGILNSYRDSNILFFVEYMLSSAAFWLTFVVIWKIVQIRIRIFGNGFYRRKPVLMYDVALSIMLFGTSLFGSYWAKQLPDFILANIVVYILVANGHIYFRNVKYYSLFLGCSILLSTVLYSSSPLGQIASDGAASYIVALILGMLCSAFVSVTIILALPFVLPDWFQIADSIRLFLFTHNDNSYPFDHYGISTSIAAFIAFGTVLRWLIKRRSSGTVNANDGVADQSYTRKDAKETACNVFYLLKYVMLIVSLLNILYVFKKGDNIYILMSPVISVNFFAISCLLLGVYVGRIRSLFYAAIPPVVLLLYILLVRTLCSLCDISFEYIPFHEWTWINYYAIGIYGENYLNSAALTRAGTMLGQVMTVVPIGWALRTILVFENSRIVFRTDLSGSPATSASKPTQC